MSFVCLIIGTFFTGLSVWCLLAGGSKEEKLPARLDPAIFPLKAIYTSGIYLSSNPILKPPESFMRSRRKVAAIWFAPKDARYYAGLIWAQILSFEIPLVGIIFLLTSLINSEDSYMILIAGLLFAGMLAYYFYGRLDELIKNRRIACEQEFPNAISKLALITNSGEIVHNAWKLVAEGKEGVFYDLMRDACRQMENGSSDEAAILRFGERTDSEKIKKFSSAMIQSIERGPGELNDFLASQSTQIWTERKQTLLQKGEGASAALMGPITLTFGGIIVLILTAAMQSFSL